MKIRPGSSRTLVIQSAPVYLAAVACDGSLQVLTRCVRCHEPAPTARGTSAFVNV